MKDTAEMRRLTKIIRKHAVKAHDEYCRFLGIARVYPRKNRGKLLSLIENAVLDAMIEATSTSRRDATAKESEQYE